VETLRPKAPSIPLRVAASDVLAEPFPHVVKDEILDRGLFDRLRAEFPPDAAFDGNMRLGGRAGRDLYPGDPAYDELLKRSPAWREFHDFIVSPDFVALTMRLFGPYLRTFECAVDPERARFVDFVESRETLAEKGRTIVEVMQRTRHRLFRPAATDDLFVRLDLAQGAKGYAKRVHCDRPNRLVSLLVYFCDADEIGLEGGELVLYEHVRKKPYRRYERHPQVEDTREIGRVRPKQNRGVFFLCTNNSYHGATEVVKQRRFRDFVYISAASRATWIW
jgi:hypothetical protein